MTERINKEKLFTSSVKDELRTKNIDYKDIVLKCLILYLFLFLSLIHVSFVYVVLFFAGIFIIFEKSPRKIYYMIFLLPFLNIIRRNSNELYYSIFLWCLVLICLGIDLFIKFFIKKEKKINIPFTILTILFLIYITIVGPLNFTNHGAAYLTMVICYCVYYYLDQLDFKETIFIFFMGVVLACILGLFRPLFSRAQEIIPSFYDGGRRFTGVSNDPNYFSGDLLICLAGFMILYDKKQINYLFYFALFVLLIFSINSLSKMMLIINILLLVIFCVYKLIKEFFKLGFYKCLAMFGVFLLSCCVCIKPILSIVERFTANNENIKEEQINNANKDSDINNNLGRVDEENPDSYYVYKFRNNKLTALTTGRTNIWLAYFEESSSSTTKLLFGHGIGAPFILCDNGYKVDYFAEHNTFVQMLYRLGIIGSVLLLLIVISTIKKSKIKGINFSNFLIMFVIFFLFMALCNLLSYRLSIYLLILTLSLCSREKDNKETKGDMQNE